MCVSCTEPAFAICMRNGRMDTLRSTRGRRERIDTHPPSTAALLEGLHAVVGRQPSTRLGPVDSPVHQLRHDRDHLVNVADELTRGVALPKMNGRKEACEQSTPGAVGHTRKPSEVALLPVPAGQGTHLSVIVRFATAAGEIEHKKKSREDDVSGLGRVQRDT